MHIARNRSPWQPRAFRARYSTEQTGVASAELTLSTPARIGPNAVIQTVAVLRDRFGAARAADIVQRATGRALDTMPEHMVEEGEVRALVQQCLRELGARQTRAVLRESGHRTAEYLLSHRIPRPVQWLLKLLPASIGVRMLLGAIGQHAWTFAGSGHFHAHIGRSTTFAIDDCPLCRGLTLDAPICDYYAGTFERLLSTLIRRDTGVVQTGSAVCGGSSCTYAVRWG